MIIGIRNIMDSAIVVPLEVFIASQFDKFASDSTSISLNLVIIIQRCDETMKFNIVCIYKYSNVDYIRIGLRKCATIMNWVRA